MFTPQDPGLCPPPTHNTRLALQSLPFCPFHLLGPGTLQIGTEVIEPTLEDSGVGFLQAGERGSLQINSFCLKPSALLSCPSPAASALPSGGSESGRSTPSLSVLSDSRPPSSTYQQAPRHFHIPGRSLCACWFFMRHCGHTKVVRASPNTKLP